MSFFFNTFPRFVALSICNGTQPSVAMYRYRNAVTLWFLSGTLANFEDEELLDIDLTNIDLQQLIKRPCWADRAPWWAYENVRYGVT